MQGIRLADNNFMKNFSLLDANANPYESDIKGTNVKAAYTISIINVWINDGL